MLMFGGARRHKNWRRNLATMPARYAQATNSLVPTIDSPNSDLAMTDDPDA